MGAGGWCGHPKIVGPTTSQTIDARGTPSSGQVSPPGSLGPKLPPTPAHAARSLPAAAEKQPVPRAHLPPPWHPPGTRPPQPHSRRGTTSVRTRGAGGATWGGPRGQPVLSTGVQYPCTGRPVQPGMGWHRERGPLPRPRPMCVCPPPPARKVRPAAPGPLSAFEAPGGSPTPGPGPPRPAAGRCVPTRPLSPPSRLPAPPVRGPREGGWRGRGLA